MGGWKLEVARMAMYMSFPVGLFYYFNQPQYFEEWVVKTKRDLYPRETAEDRRLFEDAKKRVQEIQEERMLKAYEAKKLKNT